KMVERASQTSNQRMKDKVSGSVEIAGYQPNLRQLNPQCSEESGSTAQCACSEKVGEQQQKNGRTGQPSEQSRNEGQGFWVSRNCGIPAELAPARSAVLGRVGVNCTVRV